MSIHVKETLIPQVCVGQWHWNKILFYANKWDLEQMFKKFTNDDISGQTQVKSSVQRAIKAKISEQYPLLEGEVLDTILPKKASMFTVKWYEQILIF